MSRFLELSPDYYHRSPEHVDLQNALESQIDAMQAARDDYMAQLTVDTATWGLGRWWEPIYGIVTDASKSYEFRRARVMAKKRGHGTTTKAMIENTASAYSNGEVVVTEHPRENRFVIRFVGTFGVPPNMDDLSATLEEIKPAHLTYAYEVIYRLYGELSPYTYDRMAPYTYDIIRGGKMD